jgi:hypothetical protein
MRRSLPRILLHAATAVSLVLCMAVCTLWVRSLGTTADEAWCYDRLPGDLPGADGRLGPRHDVRRAGDGTLAGLPTARDVRRPLAPGPPAGRRRMYELAPRPRGGFAYVNRPLPWSDGLHGYFESGAFQLAVPHWAVALPLAVLPAVGGAAHARRRDARRRAAAGLCLARGYDLRATPARSVAGGGDGVRRGK